jgi:hypothetical protein
VDILTSLEFRTGCESREDTRLPGLRDCNLTTPQREKVSNKPRVKSIYLTTIKVRTMMRERMADQWGRALRSGKSEAMV